MLGFSQAVRGYLSGLRRGTHAMRGALASQQLRNDEHLRNVRNVKIVDSTLREGEQFAWAQFTPRDKILVAQMLDRIGVDYIEVMSPAASPQCAKDCAAIANLGLKAKILTHTRCHPDDVRMAVESGVQGVNVYMATSEQLRKYSHGKGIEAVIDAAAEVIEYARSRNVEFRFSCEDTFRSDPSDVLRVYDAVNRLGVDRVGLADTVGVATPIQVYDTVRMVRSVIGPDTGIEFHGHNDTGCAVANSFSALQAGATHIDTCVLGIGERNGIAPLGSFLARLLTADRNMTLARYRPDLIAQTEQMVAAIAGIQVPFNEPGTGACSFHHKAGVHSKAVTACPSSYEAVDPADFGMQRKVFFNHRLVGWNVLAERARHLGRLDLIPHQIKCITAEVKRRCDSEPMSEDEVDRLILCYEEYFNDPEKQAEQPMAMAA